VTRHLAALPNRGERTSLGAVSLEFTSCAGNLETFSLLSNSSKNRELGVMLATFNRVWPLAGLTLALVATVGWIGLLGYVAIKLF
jgi:hypothetical protein